MNSQAPITKELKIINKKGLHARASAAFARCSANFNADIRVQKDGYDVGGTSIMGLMLLAASQGSTINVITSGPQADDAMTAIEDLVTSRFGENE